MIEREQSRHDVAKGRVRPESFADHYSQARQFYRSQTPVEQAHLATAIVFELSKVETVHVHVGILSHLQHIDPELAQRVAQGLGHDQLPEPAPAAAPVQDLPPSPAVQTIGKMLPTLQGRCIGILVSEGSNADTVQQYQDALKAEGASVKLVAPKIHLTLSNGQNIKADGQLAGTPSVLFDAVASILLPAEGEKLANDSAALDWFSDAYAHLKAIAACQGTQPILARAGVQPDAGVVAIKAVADFITQAKTRQWDREPKLRTLA
jgi:catalase